MQKQDAGASVSLHEASGGKDEVRNSMMPVSRSLLCTILTVFSNLVWQPDI
jgi:hypothetical protein